MNSIRPIRRAVALAAGAIIATLSFSALADDMASLATGGYARGLRTAEVMHKIDTDGDGMVSRQEWLAFQEKVFSMLDKDKEGSIDAREFMSKDAGLASFATGGYARGLQTAEEMHKIDANGDGKVTHDEFIAYQNKVFDAMDTSSTHKGQLGAQEMLATGGGNRH